jgi:integrase
MTNRFWLLKRRGIFYVLDKVTGKKESLKTKDRKEAQRLRDAKNDTIQQPAFNLALARVYLAGHDPKLLERTWTDVIERFCSSGRESTRTRRTRACESTNFDSLRNLKIVETTGDQLRTVLDKCGSFNNGVLRCLQNLALGLGWLHWPIIPPRSWPRPKEEQKRGITAEEHEKILQSEKNAERRLYYQLLWETGAAQTDAALLKAEQIDWSARLLSYQRQKTGEWSHLVIGNKLEAILKELASTGFLFPKIAAESAGARSAEFCRRCWVAGVTGVSLHCYRYAWAERARRCGYPLRFAQEALGHKSEAVHRSYARQGAGEIPPLEQYEAEQKKKIVALPVAPALAPITQVAVAQ